MKQYYESKDVILSKNHKISSHDVNNQNTILISSVGTGKTYGFIQSNILQKGCSYVISDVKGDLINKFGTFLQDEQPGLKPYKIKKLDLINPTSSMKYNPLHYIQTEEDVLALVDALIANRMKSKIDTFWINCARYAITSYIFYLLETTPKEKWQLKYIINLHNFAQQNLDSSNNAYGLLLSQLKDEYPSSKACAYYEKINCGTSQNTYGSIMVTVSEIIAPLELSSVQVITSANDEMELQNIGNERTALFIIMNEMMPYLDFLVGIMYSQLFKILYREATNQKTFRLKEHVRFLMDDFANYIIPNIDRIISSARSRNISIEMVLQSEVQLYNNYGEMGKNLIANCTYLYIAGNDLQTEENISKRMNCTISQIQNTKGKTIILFPEGKTVIDEKADYTLHPNFTLYLPYKNKYEITPLSELYEANPSCYSIVNDTTNIQFNVLNRTAQSFQEVIDNNIEISEEIKQEYESSKILEAVHLRKSKFDSHSESVFYQALINFPYIDTTNLKIHYPLREIVDEHSIMAESTSHGWSVIDMHCDLVFTDKEGTVICGIEIDGPQHYNNEKQIKADNFKDAIFKKLDIPLYRIKSQDANRNTYVALDYIINSFKDNSKLAHLITSDEYEEFPF